MKKRIPLDRIDPNPDQPRRTFPAGSLDELADSILEIGLQTGPLVRPKKGGRFEIVFGERRWRAHGVLVKRGHKRFAVIGCDVRSMSDDERDIAAIVENLQREDVPVLEEADAFARLVAKGMTDEQIATKTGAPLFRVRWRLSLQNLAPDIRKLFASDNVDRQQAMELSRLTKHDDQRRVLRLINAGKLVGWKSVRNAVEAILTTATQDDIFGADAPKPTKADAKVLAGMEDRIAAVRAMVAQGWKDGQCVIAARINPDRAGTLADQLVEIQKALRVMERELRNVTSQAVIVLDDRRKAA